MPGTTAYGPANGHANVAELYRQLLGMILDVSERSLTSGVILDEHVNAAAAIAQSKIAGLVATLASLSVADAAEATARANADTAHAAASDPHAGYTTTAEATALASAAAAALVDSAPALLDTLNELAAALGDDPNFATTVTAALAGKQPLDADLTAIAALSTTAFGRGLLALANGAALASQIPAGTFAEYVALAANPDLLIFGAITRDANGAATSAPVVWPNGQPGTYTATSVSSAFPGAVDAYTITYGSPVTRTYTQPAVTRDASGAVTNRPAITVT